MTVVFVVLAAALAVTLALVAGTWLWARDVTSKLRHLDTELRPREGESGQCGACDGAGTRVEVFLSRQASQGIVTCFRCGGTGAPPAEDRIPDLLPSPLAFRVRQLRAMQRSLR